MMAEHWDEAREALETIDARGPRRPEVLALPANVCAAQEDTPRLQKIVGSGSVVSE